MKTVKKQMMSDLMAIEGPKPGREFGRTIWTMKFSKTRPKQKDQGIA